MRRAGLLRRLLLLPGRLSQIMRNAPDAALFVLTDLTRPHVARWIPHAHAGNRDRVEYERRSQCDQHEPGDIVVQPVRAGPGIHGRMSGGQDGVKRTEHGRPGTSVDAGQLRIAQADADPTPRCPSHITNTNAVIDSV